MGETCRKHGKDEKFILLDGGPEAGGVHLENQG
jgi:hypothetical protein